MEINCRCCYKVIGNFFFGDDGDIKTGLDPKIFDTDESKSLDMGISRLFTYVCNCGTTTDYGDIEVTLLENEYTKHEELIVEFDKMSHAIKFAEFVTNDVTFDDFCFMSKEQQGEIYQLFLKEKKDEL